jgi:hypothetical protein
METEGRYTMSTLVGTLSQMNPLHELRSHFFKIHAMLFSHLRLGLPTSLLFSGLPTTTL